MIRTVAVTCLLMQQVLLHAFYVADGLRSKPLLHQVINPSLCLAREREIALL